MNELLIGIKGFEGKFKVNQKGEIFNVQANRFSKLSIDRHTGYQKVNLYCNGKNSIFLVHRIVAQTFIPNPKNLPQVHHKDGNKCNNSVDNLEWVSRKTHGEKMTIEQKTKFRESYQKHLKKRNNF
jgi:hypothetical protein